MRISGIHGAMQHKRFIAFNKHEFSGCDDASVSVLKSAGAMAGRDDSNR
jgi:hypothetical protein